MQRLITRLSGWLRRLRRPSPAPCEAAAAPVRAFASVVIPALNESARIAEVVRYALCDPATGEVIVVDDSSIDETAALAAEAGATVVTSSMLGKGASMHDGALAARNDIVVYLDGDLAGLRPGIVSDLAAPIAAGSADFVKARFGRAGGRVTELTAKPMLKVFFPELAHLAQPLGGIVAARRTLLNALRFEDAYGVDVGLLIDAHRAGARVTEVDIGSIEHDSQPLPDLTAMANEVSRVIFSRARAAGRLHVEQIAAMYEAQRQAASSVESVMTRRRGRTRLLLLDMDGTITEGRYVVELARATNQLDALEALPGGPDGDATTRSERIASLFRFVHREQFERVARTMTIRSGVVETVNALRRAGFMVGVVSDSYFVAAEILRRRIFADFALAHTLRFDADTCTGDLRINPAFLPADGAGEPCKSQVLRRFREEAGEPRLAELWAVGDDENDARMLASADRGFVIAPKSPGLAAATGAIELASFAQLATLDGARCAPGH